MFSGFSLLVNNEKQCIAITEKSPEGKEQIPIKFSETFILFYYSRNNHVQSIVGFLLSINNIDGLLVYLFNKIDFVYFFFQYSLF